MTSPSRPSTSDPVRILIGHLDTELPEYDTDRYDIRVVRFLPDGAGAPPTIAAMLAQCPPDWKPEIYYHAALVHFPIPTDIEAFEGVTATNIQDWHRGGRAVWAGSGFFDWIVTERNAVALLQASGYENALFSRLWGADPQRHRRLPNVEQDIDVLFIGSLNAAVWEERNRWLDRLALLSNRFRIVIASGHYGEHYMRLTNRAKIVFNRSVNGCTNQRAYDASLCGALVFNEAGNTEVEEIFADRVHCVYYKEENFEELLAYYLTHDVERERIVANCRDLVLADHTELVHTNALFALLAERRNSPRYRPAVQLSSGERAYRKAFQLYSQALVGSADTALKQLHQAEWAGYDRALLLEARAALHGWVGRHAEGPEKIRLFTTGIGFARQAIRTAPQNAVAQMTLGFLLLERTEATEGQPPSGRNDIVEAAVALATAAELCSPEEGTATADVAGFGYPHWADSFDAHLERSYLVRGADEAEWKTRMLSAITWRCRTMLSDLSTANAQWDEAAKQAAGAAQALPTEAEAWLRWGRCEAMRGQWNEAVTYYQAGLAIAPLSTQAWPELATLLMAMGRNDEAEAFVQQRLQVVEAIPAFAAIRPLLLAALQPAP